MSDSFGAPPPPPPPPSAPPPLPPAAPAGTPWDQRDRIGFVAALIETIKAVLLTPTDFFKAMPTSGGLGGPLVFGLVVGYAGLVVSAIYEAVFRAASRGLLEDFARQGEFGRFAGLFQGGVGLLAQVFVGPFVLVAGLFIGAGLAHLCLMLLSGAKRDFEATFRVFCFAQASAVFSVLPFCGSLAHLVYQVVLAVIGLSEAHGISRGTAAAAVLLPVVIVCCCCIGGLGAAFGSLASFAGHAR